jgi:ParB/RepB/Spo0J family partition protein
MPTVFSGVPSTPHRGYAMKARRTTRKPGPGAVEIPISKIVIGKRHRRELGDIEGLAANIRDVGLLHPVVITPGYHLIAGERRTLAFQLLKRDPIPVTIVDLDKIARGEHAENTYRKDSHSRRPLRSSARSNR